MFTPAIRIDRRAVFAGLTLAAGGLAAPALAQSGGDMADRFAATLSAHAMDAFADLFAEDYVNHQASAAAPPPPAGISMKQATVNFFAGRVRGMPDLIVTIEAKVVTPDRVAASFVYEGTQTATYLGVPPTGRRLRFTSCDIFAVAGGKFTEHWGMGDIAGVMAQLKP